MKRTMWMAATAGLLGGLAVWAGPNDSKNEPGKDAGQPDELPAAALETIKREAPGLETKVVRRIKKGMRKPGESGAAEPDLYEVLGKALGSTVMLTIDSEGNVVRRTDEVDAAAVPPMIAAAAEAATKPVGFTIRKGRKTTQKGAETYEIEATAGGMLYSIRLQPNGEVSDLRATRDSGASGKHPGGNRESKPERGKKSGPETASSAQPPPVDWR